MFNLMAFVFVQQVLITISSRMLLAIARDRGLGHLSRFLAPVHPRLKVPVQSIIFCTAWVVIFGLISASTPAELSLRRPRIADRAQRNPVFLRRASADLILRTEYVYPDVHGSPAVLLIFIRGQSALDGYDHSARYSLGKWRRECVPR